MNFYQYIQAVPTYIRKHWLIVAIGIYFLSSVLFKMATGIDLTIPCLIHELTGYHCPGCGSTRAFMSLLRLDFKAAWDWNPLIFVIVPTGIVFGWNDFSKHSKKYYETLNHGYATR